MNLSELVQSSGWKNFMSKLYGWGASVVMIGALFKIQHYPGASVMLMVGLCTESIIFFFSAFEPLHEELDWTLVYPELAGMTDTDEIETYRESAKGKDRDRGRSERQSAELETGLVSIGGLDEATIAKLNESIGKLSQTSAGLVDITEAASATKDYAQNIKLAAESVGNMNQSFNQNSVQINDSMAKLSDSYQNTANLLSQSGNDMAQKVNKSSEIIEQSYTKLSESMNVEIDGISKGSQSYKEQLQNINKNLSALNAVYELQLSDNKEHLKGTKEVYGNMDSMIQNLKDSIEETQKYKNEVTKLSQNISALNSIYGNMLSAINVMNR